MLSSQFSNIMYTRFNQSFPVQPISESRGGGTLNVIKSEQSPDGRTSLCLILDDIFGWFSELQPSPSHQDNLVNNQFEWIVPYSCTRLCYTQPVLLLQLQDHNSSIGVKITICRFLEIWRGADTNRNVFCCCFFGLACWDFICRTFSNIVMI